MKGVILAAGKGSRLYPVTRVIPKPLLPIANRMTLEYAFDQLKSCDIHEICVVVGENEQQMKEALGDGSKFDVSLTFVRQTEPKGLAHAVGFAQEFVGSDSFILYLGDAIYGESLSPFVRRFQEANCANLNLVKPVEDPRRFGVANVDGERITKLVEKPEFPESNLAMAGMYIFGSQIWDVLTDLQPSARGEYEITDAIQLLVERGETVLAGIYEGDWFDTGTLDSFLETTRFLLKGHNMVASSSLVQGTLLSNVVIGDNAKVECESIDDSVILPGANIKVLGKVSHSILGGKVLTGQSVVNSVIYDDLTA